MIKDEVLKEFSGKNVLVTGGTGLIGRQVVDILSNAGSHVLIVSLDRVKVHEKAKHVLGDLRDFNFCLNVTKDMDFVFHVAGVKGSVAVTKNKIASHFVPTLMFNTNILEACRINKIKKALYTSSIGVYSSTDVFKENVTPENEPMDFAGWAKKMGEFQIHAYKVQYGIEHFAIVRPAAVYGPGDNFDPNNAMVIPSLMYRIYNGEDPLKVWGDGSAVRDFAYSRDVAEGMVLALHYGTQGSFVNLGSGKGISIKELVETLRKVIDFNYEFDTTKPSGYPVRVMDISLAKEIIDYQPSTGLEEGLKFTWEWFLANKDDYLGKVNYFVDESGAANKIIKG